MAVYSDSRYGSFITDADISTKDANGNYTNLFRVVSLAASTANTTGRKVVLATSATDANIIGVLNEVGVAGAPVSVTLRNASGTFKVVLGANTAAVSVNDYLTVDTDSGALKTTTSGNQVIGRACEAGVAGQVIEYMPVNYKY